MADPIYAVGSFYVSGHAYPEEIIVGDCLENLRRDIDERERMLRGEPVIVERQGSKVDLKTFAGYKDEELRKDLQDLREIVQNVEAFAKEDYHGGE